MCLPQSNRWFFNNNDNDLKLKNLYFVKFIKNNFKEILEIIDIDII